MLVKCATKGKNLTGQEGLGLLLDTAKLILPGRDLERDENSNDLLYRAYFGIGSDIPLYTFHLNELNYGDYSVGLDERLMDLCDGEKYLDSIVSFTRDGHRLIPNKVLGVYHPQTNDILHTLRIMEYGEDISVTLYEAFKTFERSIGKYERL